MISHPTEERVHGDIADYYYAADGILYSYSKKTKRTVELIRKNIELVHSITGGKKVPLLIYLNNSPVPDKETRRFSTDTLSKVYSAMAMVSKPGLSQFLMSLLFQITKPPIPIKSFTNDLEAKEWLKKFVND
jgi:hypothetical protein